MALQLVLSLQNIFQNLDLSQIGLRKVPNIRVFV